MQSGWSFFSLEMGVAALGTAAASAHLGLQCDCSIEWPAPFPGGLEQPHEDWMHVADQTQARKLF